MVIRIEESEWARCVAALTRRQDVESAAVWLAEGIPGDVLVVRHLHVFEDEDYLVREVDQIALNPVSLNRAIRRGREAGWSVITVHTHPQSSVPWFSQADDHGDARLMPALHHQMDGPHGSVVIAADSGVPLARVFPAPDSPPVHASIVVVGDRIRRYPGESGEAPADERFNRQELGLGAIGQSCLRRSHVAVVGLGGTGSVVACQLGHLGVGRLTLMDGDRLEASNLSRVVGARRSDVGVPKVDVAARYLAESGLPASVDVLLQNLSPENAHRLAGCDLVVSCVDRETPRAILNRAAYAWALPVVDIGTAFRAGSVDGGRAAGRLVVVGPGRPCLACWGHLDPDALRWEALSETERDECREDGYVTGARVPEPSVISFNSQVASAAVTEVLRAIAGFGNAGPHRLAFDFDSGVVRRNTVRRRPCAICGAP